MRVLLIYPRRDPGSPVRTQFSLEKLYELPLWPLRARSYGFQFNGLETLASMTPRWVKLTVVNENLRDIRFDARVDLVAITVMVTNATRAYQISDAFRKRGVKVVLGGYHPFMVPDHALQHADAICTSEAETVWERILEDARDGKLRPTYVQEGKTDMAALCQPPRVRRREWMRHVVLTLQASRGCPFDCDFCSIIQMLGHDMRYKTPEHLCAELETIYRHDLVGRWYCRPIFFVDDNIFGRPRDLKALLRGIIALNRRYPRFHAVFGSQMTINVYKDKEALGLLQEAGFYYIFMGLESQDPATLRAYHKLHNIAFNYDDAVATLRAHDMEVIASFIFGTDTDTEACFEAAYEFFDRTNVLYPYFNILTPTAKQWFRFLDEGRLITAKAKLYDAHHTVFVPMLMTPRRLQEGFIALVNRTFDYGNVAKRLLAARPARRQRHRLALPLPLEKLTYAKIHWTLGRIGDQAGQRFLEALRPHVWSGRIPMAEALLQIDQHDWAVRNQATLRECHSLDVPAWGERGSAAGREPTAAGAAN
jgi:hypothetical protein